MQSDYMCTLHYYVVLLGFRNRETADKLSDCHYIICSQCSREMREIHDLMLRSIIRMKQNMMIFVVDVVVVIIYCMCNITLNIVIVTSETG